MNLEKKLKINRLFDYYGKLLTENQQEQIRAYYLLDMSLSEIAEQSGVSRQAVRDGIVRAENALVDFEEKVGFIKFVDSLGGDEGK